MARRTLPEDPRWLPFMERYSGDIVAFSIEVRGQVPSFQQVDLFSSVAQSRSRTSVASGHGCFGAGTEIMMFDGSVRSVENIRVGDKLMGDDGKSARNVLSLCHGRERMYRFTYSDNTSHVFNESHTLCLVATNTKGTRRAGNKITVTVRDWLAWGEDKKRCHAAYRSGIDHVEKSDLPLSPYFLGIWLGDGNSVFPSVTTMDAEVLNEVMRCADAHGCRVTKVNQNRTGAADIYNIAFKAGIKNPVTKKLEDLGVVCNKHIPSLYLTADINSRLELLAGLIDTDGSRDGAGYDFIQKSMTIAKQVCWLARSVGCHATVKMVTKKCANNGAIGNYWRVTIGRNADLIPVRIERKKVVIKNAQRRSLHFGIKHVESIGEDDYYGFELDGNNKFLGGDFTVLHNTGKTTALATIIFWHLLCHEQSVTLVTANDMDQLKATLWKEIAKAHEEIRRGVHGWIADYVEIMANLTMRVVGFEKTWFVESKTADDKSANKMAGRHAKWLLIIGDEASTLDDGVCSTLAGALTEEHNRMLLTSQFTRNAGYFYSTHNALSMRRGGAWNNLTFSSFDSPHVSNEALLELWNAYDDDERRVRLLGLPPADSSKHMMNLRVAESMYTHGRIIDDSEDWGWVVAVDVAAGEGRRDKSACVIARVIGYGDSGESPRRVEIVEIPIHTNDIKANVLASHVLEAVGDRGGVTFAIDATGLGFTVYQDVVSAGRVANDVHWARPCFSTFNSERYLNQRAQAMHHAARAAKDGRLSILTNEYKNTILDQSSRIPKTFNERGKMRVPEKGGKEWEGQVSPDAWDAICILFLDNLFYMPSGESGDDDDGLSDCVSEFAQIADDFFESV